MIRYMAAGRVLYERVKTSEKARRTLRIVGVCLLVVLVLVADAAIFGRLAANKAVADYKAYLSEIETERVRAEYAAVEPYERQLNEEADMMAKVLYGVKDNDNDDLRTYCWCVFNRTDNPSFPSSLADVIGQPNQWMRYSEDNPVLENLYQLAREQLDAWHSQRRPVSNEFLFMNWTEKDIVLRDNFKEGSQTHYWRWGQ